MQTPPCLDGQRRPVSDRCDVILQDVEDGIVIVVDHKDTKPYTMRFDFSPSVNLRVGDVGPDVERPSSMQCNLVVAEGTQRNVVHLQIIDEKDMDHLEMRYRVQCLIRNAKGELVPIDAPTKATGGPKEEREPINEHLTLIRLIDDFDQVFFVENAGPTEWQCEVNTSGSVNYKIMCGPGATPEGPTGCRFTVGPNLARTAFVKLTPADGRGDRPVLKYSVSATCPAGESRRQQDDAAAKKAADDAAAKKAADDAAAKKAADDAAAKKAADDAAKKAADAKPPQQRVGAAAAQAKAPAVAGKPGPITAVSIPELVLEEPKKRDRIEIEQRGKYVLLQRELRESLCALCRRFIRPNEPSLVYKLWRVHQVCFDRAPKCDWCGDVLIGEYKVTKGDLTTGVKLHNECVEPYKLKARPVCVGCQQQIMDGAWSSRNGKAYHHGCRPAAS